MEAPNGNFGMQLKSQAQCPRVHQGLDCIAMLLIKSFWTEIYLNLVIQTCDLSIWTMHHHKSLVSINMEKILKYTKA